MKALTAFGARGYGPEAAEAILNVAQEYDSFTFGDTPDGKFGDAIVASLAYKIPKKDWLPLLRVRFDADPVKWQVFAMFVLIRASSSDEKTNDGIRNFLLQLAQRPNEFVSTQAYGSLVVRYPNSEDLSKLLVKQLDDNQRWAEAVRLLGFAPLYPPQVTDLVLHGDPKKQIAIRESFEKIRPGSAQKALVATLIDILKDDSKSADHIAAIRTLAAFGRSGSTAGSAAAQVLGEIAKKGPLEKQVAAAFALQRLSGGRTQAVSLLYKQAHDADGKDLPVGEIEVLLNKESETFAGK